MTPDIWVSTDTHCKLCEQLPSHPLPGCLMIRYICRSKNSLIGIHFAELIHNKMSDTEEVMEEEEGVLYVLIFILLYIHIVKEIRNVNIVSMLTNYYIS